MAESLEPRCLLSAAPVISELMADGDQTLLDGNGVASDWIEIFNGGDATADLGGWHLTDDPGDLEKWTFPAAPLSVGEYLVVFASGDAVPDGAGNLHTNFKLDAAGDYLALVAPNGRTIASEFGPDGSEYPRQREDISYGIVQGASTAELIGDASPAAVLIPTNGLLGTTWTEPDFNPDAAWQSGPTGIGYDSVPMGSTNVLRLDLNDRTDGESGTANTELGFETMTLATNGSTHGGVTVTLSALGGAFLDDRDRSTPRDNPPALTQDQLYDDFIFANGTFDGAGMQILVEGLAASTDYEVTLWVFDSGSVSGRVSDWIEVSGDATVVVESNYTFDGSRLPSGDQDNTITAVLTSSPNGTLQIEGRRNGGVSHGVFLNALQIVSPGLTGLIRTDVADVMKDQNSSAWIRIPFEVPAELTADLLALQINYDAGFVAYLNGTEVARRNAPGEVGTPLPFDAAATHERSLAEVRQFEQIPLTAFAHLLNPGGSNVLAIAGLNAAADDSNFLILPKLSATMFDGQGLRYFTTPTPGQPNGDGLLGLVADTTFTHDRGFYDAPFELEIETDTASADIYYTTDGSQPTAANSAATRYSEPITIAATTTLRAVAFKDAFVSSNIDTQTYLFLDQVITQDPLNDPTAPSYPTVWQAGASADFEMDPDVVAQWDDTNPANTDIGIRQALQSLPTMSIVMDHDDLWSASSGIYPNATSRGSAWRRGGSIEYFDPQSGEQFQVNGGIQMHGGASRDNVRLKKHSFRLVFNDQFDGPNVLSFPLFGASATDKINTVVLRASFTDAFATRTVTGRYSPIDSQYTRDVWVRDSQLAMGHLSAHSTFVHLYINGLYWGMYSPAERPDDAFVSAYQGGARDDWDIVKDFNELFRGSKTTWNAMFALADQLPNAADPDAIYARLQGNDPDGTPNPDLPNYLDMDNFVDFMLLHLYAGAEDWPHHNWYAARNRNDPGKGFQFFVWDQEIVLDGRFRDLTGVGTASNHQMTPAELYDKLRRSPEFRLHFADRVQKHLFDDGALTVEANRARWQARADQVEAAIVAESARWGDAREGERVRVDSGQPTVTSPTMPVDLGRAARDDVAGYFPQSQSLAIERFRARGLFPLIDAAQFSHPSGTVAPDTELTLSAAAGTVYYTLDGSDPRLRGGDIAPGALVASGPIPLSGTTTVTARAHSGTAWSALSQGSYTAAVLANANRLTITEVNYHPHAALLEFAELDLDDEEFEFIELANTSDVPISLFGVHFTDGVQYEFGNDLLDPGAQLVVVRNSAAFRSRYGSEPHLAGEFTSGGLANDGETIALAAADGTLIARLTYNDRGAWPGRADGVGATLERIDPASPIDDPGSWRASNQVGGSPGTVGIEPVVDLIVNEILSRPATGTNDVVELYNTTPAPIDLGGWYLSDDDDNLFQSRLDPVTIGGHDYVTIDVTQIGLALDGQLGDELYLVASDPITGRPLRFVDHVTFAGTNPGMTLGRWPDGDPNQALFPMTQPTLGGVNSGPALGAVVISEIHYHPAPPPDGSLITQDELEFVEVTNRSGTGLVLGGWWLDGFGFQFPDGTVLAPGATAVVVRFDPVTEPDKASEFHGVYAIAPQSITLLGPASGTLQNGGERLKLLRPLSSGTPGGYALVDQVRYDDHPPWPIAADGSGASLTRLTLDAFGDLAANWTAGEPTPGTTPRVIAGDVNGDGQVNGLDVDPFVALLVAGQTDAAADMNGDGLVNGLDVELFVVALIEG